MSPIQEETGDDVEEGEGQDPEYEQPDSCAESLPDCKKRAKKFKKMKTEQVPAGERNVGARGAQFCVKLPWASAELQLCPWMS